MDRIQIKGYKRLQDVRLEELGQINYLVGGNASGKSSILEALTLMGWGLDMPVTSGTFSVPGFSKHAIDAESGMEVALGASGKLDVVMKLDVQTEVDTNGNVTPGRGAFFARDDKSTLTCALEVGNGNRIRRIAAINTQLESKNGFGIKTLYLSTRPIEENTHAITPIRAQFELNQIDDTLKKSLLDFLNKHHKHSSGQKFVDIVRAMQSDNAILLKLAEIGNDNKGEFYYSATAKQHPILSLSDGTRALLGLFYGIEKQLINGGPERRVVRVICIEEPEYGLHPDNQKKVSELLDDFAARYPDVKFFVTTHSPFIISRAAKFKDKKHKIYLLNKGHLNNLLGEQVEQSKGFYGEACLNVVAKMLGAGFDDLNAMPATAEALAIVYCEGEDKEMKDSQLYKRIFRDENVVFVSAKSFRDAVIAFRTGQQAASFVFGSRASARVLVDRSNGCHECKTSGADHSKHPQEFSIAEGINIQYTHKDRLRFDDDERVLIEGTEPSGCLRVLGRKELENYLFDPSVVALLDDDSRNLLTIPEDVDYVNGEVKDRILGKSAAIYKALADIIYDHKKDETKCIYDELASFIGLAQ